MPETRQAICPTCKQHSTFERLGEQRWPAEVAAKLGLPSVIVLWSCMHCLSTISEPDLLPLPESGAASADSEDVMPIDSEDGLLSAPSSTLPDNEPLFAVADVPRARARKPLDVDRVENAAGLD